MIYSSLCSRGWSVHHSLLALAKTRNLTPKDVKFLASSPVFEAKKKTVEMGVTPVFIIVFCLLLGDIGMVGLILGRILRAQQAKDRRAEERGIIPK